MSYQVLARKWRPQNFKEMVGQEHVLKALIHALDNQRLHHAYLFTGTRGVGKTTIGRILAKCLSCQEKVTSEPCGQCDACRSISEGRYVDLIEIDAASRTKVEDMRELLDNVQYAPSQGRFKIYLIDEVHMLSTSSFNALLKTLEEPPSHVKFLFATTDPQKLPVTILSRCLQFNLKNMAPEKIVQHLSYILKEEQVGFEEPALWALALAADGSMRDALSLTDQAIAYGNHQLSETGVSSMLGTVDQKKVFRILDALIQKNAPQMFAEIRGLADFSPDYRSVLASISSIFHRVAIEQVVPGSIDNALGDQQQVQSYAQRLCVEDVQLFYQIALTSRQDILISPDPKSGFEMALLRMLAFQLTPVAQQSNHSLGSSQVASVEQKLNENADEEPEPPQSEKPDEEPNNDISGAPDYSAEDIPADYPDIDAQSSEQDQEYAAETYLYSSETSAEAQTTENLDPSQNLVEDKLHSKEAPDAQPEGWNAQVLELGLSGMTLNFMLNSMVELDDTCVKVYVESGHFRLLNDNHKQRVQSALLDVYKNAASVEFIDGLLAQQETPMMWRERKAQEKKAFAKQVIMDDPHVKAIIDTFDGRLIEQSIQPTS